MIEGIMLMVYYVRPFHLFSDLYTIGMNNYETRKPAKPENAAGRAVLAMVSMPVLERTGRAQIAAPTIHGRCLNTCESSSQPPYFFAYPICSIMRSHVSDLSCTCTSCDSVPFVFVWEDTKSQSIT